MQLLHPHFALTQATTQSTIASPRLSPSADFVLYLCEQLHLCPLCTIPSDDMKRRKEKKDKSKNTDADQPRRRGRPPNVVVRRGRQAAKYITKALFGDRTPTPDPALPGPEAAPATGGVLLTGETAHDAALAGEEYGVPTEREDPDQTGLVAAR
ncbi:hypothetical protein B0H17DRAFT_1213106 [Mycena rosella]|uniref:Uncharacterized protein n=1 Tax=Mycena rosella TaxID=1033263 RepID=A0AAD7CQW8_MYCRO|nr:hypothetical protein B0H17DRAFT_1213106 [Mycena rosella]